MDNIGDTSTSSFECNDIDLHLNFGKTYPEFYADIKNTEIYRYCWSLLQTIDVLMHIMHTNNRPT